MSKTKLSTATCPNCNKEFSVRTWESLNAQLNPEENEAFLAGKFFKFKCTCGHIMDIDYPMLYNNMEKKIMIHYVYPEKAGEANAYLREIQNFGPFSNLNYRFRIVTSQNELREKAIIFSNDLDDRLIEIVKLFAFLQLRESYPNIKINEILFYIDSNTKEMSLDFLGSENITMTVTEEFYNDICLRYKDAIDEIEREDFFVNGHWALEFFENNK